MSSFEKAWNVVKMGREHDDEERRLIQHIVSMAMGMNDDEADSYGGGYMEGLTSSAESLSDLVRQRYGETGGSKGGYMRDDDLDSYLDDWPYNQMDDDAISALSAKVNLDDDDAYENAMQSWLKENPYTPRPSDSYEAPMMVRGDMAKVMQYLMSNPEVYMHSLDEGGLEGLGMQTDFPNMEGMYRVGDHYGEEGPMPTDTKLGEGFSYRGDDDYIRGRVEKIKLMDMIRRLMG